MKKITNKVLFNNAGKLTSEVLKSLSAPEEIQFEQPLPVELNYQEATRRIMGYTEASDIDRGTKSFTKRSQQLVNELARDYKLKNVLLGNYYPILLPQLSIFDLGKETKTSIETFRKEYRSFTNKHINRAQGPSSCITGFRYKQLENRVRISKGSRYSKLQKKRSEESVAALYIPRALHAGSPRVLTELMHLLPGRFILASPIEAATALTMYLEYFVDRTKNTSWPHRFNCAGTLYTQYKSRFFNFVVSDYGFYFGGEEIQTQRETHSFDLLFIEN